MSKRRREKQLENVNLLEITPVRLAESEEVAGLIVVLRPRSRRGGLSGAMDRLFYLLSARRIRLDTFGSFMWQRLDGKTKVRELATALRAEFGDAVEPAEPRLGHMIQVLRRENLVGYPGWDDEAIRACHELRPSDIARR